MASRAAQAHALVAGVREALGARAAGLWFVQGKRLVQAAFVPGPTLDGKVAEEFARLTRMVRLDQADLGIVKAVLECDIVESRATELPAEAGSGRWLRAFDAERSVALPLRDEESGTIIAVISVALEPSPASTLEVAQDLHLHVCRLLEEAPEDTPPETGLKRP